MKKIPNIFKPESDHRFDNNKKVYYSYLDNIFIEPKDDLKRNAKLEDPSSVIYRLSHGGSYIFNKNVIIKTRDKTYRTKIAGTINNRVITLDGNSILLDDIISIDEV